MKREKIVGEFGIRGLIPRLLLLAVLAAGCHGGVLSLASGPVPEADRTVLAEGSQSGSWRGTDLSLSYRYLKSGNNFDIYGQIDFRDKIIFNYEHLDNLSVSIYFLDNQGNILGTHGLFITSRMETDTSPSFHATMASPPGAAAVAFSYSGQVGSVSGDSQGRDTMAIHDGPR